MANGIEMSLASKKSAWFSQFDDPILCYARIGYRTFLNYRDVARSLEAP
jgi:hypothetical protein